MGDVPHPSLRHRVFHVLDQGSSDPLPRFVDLALIGLVVATVVAAVLESVPDIEADYARFFDTIEIVAVAAFTIEYGLRIWVAPEQTILAALPDWRARLAFLVQPGALVDLASIAPVYVALFSEADLRSLLVIRLIRFFKLARYSPGLASLVDAITAERRALSACGVILLGTVLVSATAMHFAERGAQPDKLGTIPDAMYWAFITLATVGYGDVVPITPLGKVIASVTAVIGIGMLALPVGILASTFADEIRRRDFVVTMTMVAKVPLFADLDVIEVAEIMRCLVARSFEPGQPIVRKGEVAQAMFFVSSGIVEVDVPGLPQLGPGDFFGEVGLIYDRERNATVTAVTRARLLALEAQDLKALMTRFPRMGDRIREVAEGRREPSARSGG